MANSIISLSLFALWAFALPSATATYLLLVAGRRVAGRTGLIIAAAIACGLVLVTVGMLAASLIQLLQAVGSRTSDDLNGVAVFGSMALGSGLGVGLIFFFHWHN